MPTTTLNATFDGINPATTLGGSVPFNDGFLGYYSQYLPGAENDLVANISLSGSDWTVAAMRFGVESNDTQVNITDLNGGTDRRINYLKLGANSDVDLMSIRIQYMHDGDLHDITLGAQWTNSINIGATNNIVTTGDGYVGNIEVWNGSALITANGGVGAISLTDGDDTVIVQDGAYETSVSIDGGDNEITVQGGG